MATLNKPAFRISNGLKPVFQQSRKRETNQEALPTDIASCVFSPQIVKKFSFYFVLVLSEAGFIKYTSCLTIVVEYIQHFLGDEETREL